MKLVEIKDKLTQELTNLAKFETEAEALQWVSLQESKQKPFGRYLGERTIDKLDSEGNEIPYEAILFSSEKKQW